MAKRWHKKHFSTKWTILILGVLVFGLVVLIPFLQKEQDQRSDAASNTCQTNANVTHGNCLRGMQYAYDYKLKNCNNLSGNSSKTSCKNNALSEKNKGIAKCNVTKTNDLNKCYQQLPSCTSKGGKCRTSSCLAGQTYLGGVKCESQSQICCRGISTEELVKSAIKLHCQDNSWGCSTSQYVPKGVNPEGLPGSAWQRAPSGNAYCESKGLYLNGEQRKFCLIPNIK